MDLKNALAARGRGDEFLMADVVYDPEGPGDVYLITQSPFWNDDLRYRFTPATQSDLADLVPAIMEGRLAAITGKNTVTYPPAPTQTDVARE